MKKHDFEPYVITERSLRIQACCLFSSATPLQVRTCSRPSLSPKKLKILRLPARLSCCFSVTKSKGNIKLSFFRKKIRRVYQVGISHHEGTLLSKLILTNMQDIYLSTTSNANLLPTLSPNIKILFHLNFTS